MRSQKTVEKWLKRMENKYRAGSCFTNEEEWGIIYALKWVLSYDLSELQNEAMKRASERIRKLREKSVSPKESESKINLKLEEMNK